MTLRCSIRFSKISRASAAPVSFLRGASLTVKPTASRDMSTWWEQQQQLEQEQKRAGAYTGVDNYSAIASSTLEGAPPSKVRTLADEAAEADEIRCGGGPPLPVTKSGLWLVGSFVVIAAGAYALYSLST